MYLSILPPELLFSILEHLSHDDVLSLRQTCWSMRYTLTRAVNLSIEYHCGEEEEIVCIGAPPELGNWDIHNAPSMYSNADGKWESIIRVPLGSIRPFLNIFLLFSS